jgi:membrane fusion protein, multidrug efflux system
MFRKSIVLLPASALLATVALSGCRGAQEEPGAPAAQRVQAVEVAHVERQTLADTLLVVGSLAPNESTEIRAEVAGIIRQIPFTEGERVEEGDLLVQLDDRELQAQLREAQVRLELARQTLTRSENLLETRSVPESDRDRALAEFERIQAELELLNVRLDRTRITAPFAGWIGERRASPGDLVGPADVLSRLTDLSRLKVEFTVPERHADQIRQEATVRVLPRAGSTEAVNGQIYFVSPVIDRATRSLAVKAYVESPPPSLLPGMFVQVEVVLQTRENVLTVPETAILPRDGRHFVAIVEQNGEGRDVIAFRPVSLGLRRLGIVEVVPLGGGGLNEGQQVVAAGLGALPLFPGAPVETRPMRGVLAQETGQL